MKKIVFLAILLMMSVAVFAKGIPLQVTETEWGLEISNINQKGKIICKSGIKFENKSNVDADIFILANVRGESFDTEEFYKNIENTSFYSPLWMKYGDRNFSAHNVFGDDTNNKKSWVQFFTEVSGVEFEFLRNSNSLFRNALSIKDERIDKFFVVSKRGKITKYKAFSNGAYFHLEILGFDNDTQAGLEWVVKEKEIGEKKEFENKGGYDHMPWGTSVRKFLDAHPEAKKIESEGVVEIYTRKGSSGNDMVYKFYEEKLVGGVTAFYNMTDETAVNEFNQRMKELYGEPNDVKETSEHHVENINFLGNHRIAYTERHVKVNWKKSPTFNILLDVCALDGDTKKDTQNICLFITTNIVKNIITYENPSMAKQIAESNAKFEKEQAEAKKAKEEAEKRERMNNLDL